MPLLDLTLLIVFIGVLAFDYQGITTLQNNDELSPANSTNIKGIMALMILLHHIERYSIRGGILFDKVGYLCVAVFLFLSGYGLVKSYQKSQHQYIKKLVCQKIPTLILWSAFTVLLMYVFYWVVQEPVKWNELIDALLGNRLLNWYFPACILLGSIPHFV